MNAPTLPGMGETTCEDVPPAISAGQDRRAPLMATCGGCNTTWPADTAAAHCTACHRTWRSAGGFDDHRVSFTCRTETEIRARGYLPDERGVWRQPRPAGTLPDSQAA